jgi:hypothetical protein
MDEEGNKTNPYTPQEHNIAERFSNRYAIYTYNPNYAQQIQFGNLSPSKLKKWLLVGLRKLRVSDTANYNIAITRYSDINSIIDLSDWIAEILPDLRHISIMDAITLSEQWHATQSFEAEGDSYEPTKAENIIYGPQWKNQKYNGWTIQKVTSKTDLEVEGEKMNHCVGGHGYCYRVEGGTTEILSLRDPSNEPHVTMEFEKESNVSVERTLQQSKGKSNSDPKEEYKEMIREWASKTNEYFASEDEGRLEEQLFEISDVDELLKVFDNHITRMKKKIKIHEEEQKAPSLFPYQETYDTDEYGLRINDSLSAEIINLYWTDYKDVAEEAIKHNGRSTHRHSDTDYLGDITDVPYMLRDLAVNNGKMLDIMKKTSNNENLISELNKLEETMQDMESLSWDNFISYNDSSESRDYYEEQYRNDNPPPQRNQFSTDEEYQQELSQYETQVEEYTMEEEANENKRILQGWAHYAVPTDTLQAIQEYKEKYLNKQNDQQTSI